MIVAHEPCCVFLQGTEQFHCEVKVLSRVCHPHVVRLLASCPSQGCLVYELLPNGSLEDRLDCLVGLRAARPGCERVPL